MDSVAPFITNLNHRLKWLNLIVVQIDSASYIDSIKQFSFVDSLAEIQYVPNRSLQSESKFESVYEVDQSIVYPNKYGAAYRQANMLNVDLLHQMGFKGDGITLSVMDNGFYNTDNIRAYDSVRNRIIGTWDFVNNEANVYNDGSHGENVFSCIAANLPYKFIGTAPNASFYLLTTEDNSAEWVMEEYSWAAAAEYADSAGVQIFSTSLGYTTFNNDIGNHTYADLTGDKTVITHASNMAFGKGILVLNSAGNEGANAWHYISAPADGDSVLAIGAVDSAEVVANFSGRGTTSAGRIKPDICSQGVRSAVIQTDGSVGYSGGTSFSCPIMAGAAACLWGAFPDKTAREIYEVIVMSADHFWSPDNNHGYGVPNFYNAYLLLKTNYNDKILKISEDVTLYPNPFSDELNISLYNEEPKAHTIEIFDLQGRRVYAKEIFIRDRTFNLFTAADLKTLSVGEYVLRYDGSKKFSHRIIKAK